MGFYVLEPDGLLLFGTKWAYADQVDPVDRGEGADCPVCGRPIGGLEWLPPHRVKLSSAKADKWGDFLWGAGFQLMVSKRFKALYEAEGLRGITEFYPPAEIMRVGRRKTGDIPSSLPDYYLVKIAWNGADLDDAGSGVVRKPHPHGCTYCRGAVRSLECVVIDEHTWDGSDIFEARGLYGTIVVSERFRALVRTHDLKNAYLIPAENCAYDERRPGLWHVKE